MAIQWKERWATGVTWQDAHHKELFKRIDGLMNAMMQNKGAEEVSEVFKFLSDYVVIHFNAEEEAMSKYSYPDTAQHKVEHKRFTGDVLDLKRKFEEEASSILVVRTLGKSTDWFIGHVTKTDKALGEFLKAKM